MKHRRMSDLITELKSRLTIPAILLTGVFVFGTLGYRLLGHGEWTLLQCAFMTAITLTTVGYGDILGVENSAAATIFTMVVMLIGMGVVLYSVSTITAFIVEGGINLFFKERKMLNRISKLDNHFIIAGAGGTGVHVVEEMHKSGVPFVIIDSNNDNLATLEARFGEIFYVDGDATEDENLVKAGIERAKGIVACLSNDKDNLYLTVTAKNLNPDIKVVARAIAPEMRGKLNRVGADYVVSPNQIGGLRMASEVIRPHVVSFLDRMLRAKEGSVRVAEVAVGAGSPVAGAKLRESGIHDKTGLLVVAVIKSGKDDILYNPAADYIVSAGDVLIVIGGLDAISKLEQMAG